MNQKMLSRLRSKKVNDGVHGARMVVEGALVIALGASYLLTTTHQPALDNTAVKKAATTLAPATAAAAAVTTVPRTTTTMAAKPSTTTTAALVAAASSGTGLKAPLTGLLDGSGQPPASYLGVIGGWVVNVPWSALQPTPGGPIAPKNAIDRAIATVTALNAAHPGLNLGLRIRTGAASTAPTWLKDEGGAPITVHNPQGGQTATVGRFWTAQYGAAYAQFESELAAKYDDVPVVREVDISRCSLIFDEDMIRYLQDTTTSADLLAAGYTVSADQSCQEQQVQEMKVWHHTRLDYAFNPYQEIAATGNSPDVTFTDQMMSYCRAVLGRQCVLFNESIRSPITELGIEYAQMYATMKQLGAPIAFETALDTRVGDVTSTLQWAKQEGAECVELPDAGAVGAPTLPGTPASFSGWPAQLAANA
jgi:hypothetical protein